MANNFEDPGQDKPYAKLLGGLFDTALEYGKGYLPKPKTAAPPPASIPQANVPASGMPAWLKPVLIGVSILAGLLVLASVMSGARKG